MDLVPTAIVVLTRALKNQPGYGSLDILITEVERLRAVEARLRDLALTDAGPRGRWAAEVIAIRRADREQP